MPTIVMHFAAQVERRSFWRRAKRGGVVTCGVVSEEGRAPGTGPKSDGHTCLPCPLQFEQIMMTLLYRVMVVSWLSVLVVAA